MCKQVKKERKMFSFFRRSLLMTLYSPFEQQFYLKKVVNFISALTFTISEKTERLAMLGMLKVN